MIVQTLLFGPPNMVRVRLLEDSIVDAHIRPGPKKPEHLEPAKTLQERNERRPVIAVYEAGRLAEEVLELDGSAEDGCSSSHGYYGGEGSDFEVSGKLQIAATAGDNLPDVGDDWIETIQACTKDLLQRHEGALRGLATEIASRGEFAGEALIKLLAQYGVRHDEMARQCVMSFEAEAK